MKIALYLFLLHFFSILFCFSQDPAVYIGKIPTEGILLDKGWKFHNGDDFAWAKPDFDDHNWESTNPAPEIKHIPQFQKTSIGWLRLSFRIDSPLLNQPKGVMFSQVGASEEEGELAGFLICLPVT
jgi:hypothetical protein